MLKEAMEERKGMKPTKKSNSFEMELELDAYIPDAYISDGHQKIEMYKRFRSIDSLEDLEEIARRNDRSFR